MATNHDRPSRLRFSDGMEFDLGGDLRVVHRRDGWYVVGRGMLIPVDDAAEGNRMIKDMQHKGGANDALRT
ncbi:MAG: hypothetical protein IPK64_01665 [bacterium]|nr:hypothetical protein [bacterium]